MTCSIRAHTTIVFTSFHYFIFDIIIILVVRLYYIILLYTSLSTDVYIIITLCYTYIPMQYCCDGFTIHIGGKLRRAYTYLPMSYAVHTIRRLSFEKILYGSNISSDFRHKLKYIYLYRLCCTCARII